MAIDFPDSPTDGQEFTSGSRTYVYSSSKGYWEIKDFDLQTVGTSILPSSDITYDLGSSTKRFKDGFFSGSTLHIGNAQLKADTAGTAIELPVGSVIQTASGTPQTVPSKIEDLSNVDLEVIAETLTINVDETDAGHGTQWKWSWDAGNIAYARGNLLNTTQDDVPIYKGGVYTVNNFAANTPLYGNQTQTHQLYLKWIEGAGIDNVVDLTTWGQTVNNTSKSVTVSGIRGGTAVNVHQFDFTVPTGTITPPTLTPPTVTYNVAAGTGVYTFSGTNMGDNITIGPLYKGGTYTFTLDASVSGHPFYLTTDDGTNYSSGNYVGEYTDGVTGSRNQSGNVVFTVPANAPATLYYQCGLHGSMRGTINIKDLAVVTDANGDYVLSWQHTQEGHASKATLTPKPSIVGQMCIVYNSTTNRFEPQDLGVYVDETDTFREKIESTAKTAVSTTPSVDGTNLSVGQGGAVDLTTLARTAVPFTNSSGTTLTVGATNIDIAPLARTAVPASLNGNTLTVGTTDVDLSSFAGSSVAFSDVTSTPTTLAGYGITDALSEAPALSLSGNTLSSGNKTVDLSSLSTTSELVLNFRQTGTLAITTGTKRWYAPKSVTFTKITARVDTAPVGSALNVDINKNGVSAVTISVADGQTKTINSSPSLSMVEDDYLTVDIDQIGSSTAGSELTITFTYT